MKKFRDILNSLLEEWNSAEEALKIAENVQGKVVAPSINELRYAGRKVIEALSFDDDDEQARRLLDDAIFDCMRARHDAIDAIIAFISNKISAYTNELGVHIVLQCYPDTPKLIEEIGYIQDQIEVSRKNRLDRNAVYSTLQSADIPKIIRMWKGFQNNENLCESLPKKKKRK